MSDTEMFAFKMEEGPSTTSPMDFDDTAYAFRAIGDVLEKLDVYVGVDSVSMHESGEVGHLQIWIWGWTRVVDWLRINREELGRLVGLMQDYHTFDSVEQGVEFLQNLLNSSGEWDPFVTNGDELNLIVRV